VTRLLAEGLVRAGHQATIVTNQKGEAEHALNFQLLRCPGAGRLISAYRSARAVILQGPAMRLGWPLLWMRHSAVMVHHMALKDSGNPAIRWFRAKLARRVHHAAVSRALARSLPWPVEAILPNPYDDCLFRMDAKRDRTHDILFVGRLIPEKGAQILLKAVALLRQRGSNCAVTLVGTGPQRDALEKFIANRRLENQVRLSGQVTGQALAGLFQQHRILVVPSLQPEGFGLVALEAIACGCAVVGSNLGGLPEAIEPCGTTVPPGDEVALAERLGDLLQSRDESDRFCAEAKHHLAKHRPDAVSEEYLKLIAKVVEIESSERWAEHTHDSAEREDPSRSCVSS
jgi:glycogen(starch) synthase